jgi:molecular chaperone DnaK (HSP70)
MVELKNEGESLTYNTEKQLKENDAKISQEIKDRIRSDIAAVQEATSNNNNETLKESLEKLRNSAMEMGRSIYQNASDNSNAQSQEQNQEQSQEQTQQQDSTENKDKDSTQDKK